MKIYYNDNCFWGYKNSSCLVTHGSSWRRPQIKKLLFHTHYLSLSQYPPIPERRELKTKQTQFNFSYSSTQATAPSKHPVQNCSTLAISNQHPWWLAVQTFITWQVIGCSKFGTWTSNIYYLAGGFGSSSKSHNCLPEELHMYLEPIIPINESHK